MPTVDGIPAPAYGKVVPNTNRMRYLLALLAFYGILGLLLF